MSKVVGYVLYGHDNDSYMLENQQGLNRCSTCGELLDRSCSVDSFRLRKKYDLSGTYDGYTIASLAFREAWHEAGSEGLDFISLPSAEGFFLVQTTRVLEFDAVRRKTRFEGYHECCQRYESVVGATPAFVKHPKLLESQSAYGSDLMFGTGDEKSSLIMIPLSLGEHLKRFKLSGMDLAEVLE
jgi:hypothetical protein